MPHFAKSLTQTQILIRLRRINPQSPRCISACPLGSRGGAGTVPVDPTGWVKLPTSLTLGRLEYFETVSRANNIIKKGMKSGKAY